MNTIFGQTTPFSQCQVKMKKGIKNKNVLIKVEIIACSKYAALPIQFPMEPHQELTTAAAFYKRSGKMLWKKTKWCPCLTSITIVQVGKLVPLVVLDKAEEGPLDVRPHLDDKLLIPIQREAGRYEGDMERPTK